MSRNGQIMTLMAALAVLAGPHPSGTGQDVPPQDSAVAAALLSIRQDRPSFLVHAEVNRRSRDYREGDALEIRVRSEADAYLHVLYQQADGRTYQIFPNRSQPVFRVKAGVDVIIPGRDDQFRWKTGPPFGAEMIKVIATDQPLHPLSADGFRRERFNSVSADDLKRARAHLSGAAKAPGGTDTASGGLAPVVRWAETDLPITTYAAASETSPPGSRRLGVFFGVSNHVYSSFEEAATGRNSDLSTPRRDAEELRAVMREIGQLADSRVYVDDQATRGNLEQAMCEWLPAQSRPGDTVFVYFSGHGGQFPDRSGDEADQLDEYLVPSDCLNAGSAAAILAQHQSGTLDAGYAGVARRIQALAESARSVEELQMLLIEQTAVTDDLFAHWLQRLSGRRVIVILDICHAGGFAESEKGRAGNAGRKTFDFLETELSRLKDIGQTDTALLTSSSTAQVSLVRPEDDLSVMTYWLIEGLVNATGPVDVTRGFQLCAAGMDSYFHSPEFESVNTRRVQQGASPLPPHQPQLWNHLLEPVFLKP